MHGIEARTAGVDRQMARALARLSRLRVEAAEASDALADARLRMLIAETPVADEAVVAGAARLRRVREALRAAESALACLQRDRLDGGETAAPVHP